MVTYELLQNYWWLLISVLGALLVFMLFVQGGQSMLLTVRDEMERTMIVNSLGRKWELSFTMLVVFGGAFFASFPLFYSVYKLLRRGSDFIAALSRCYFWIFFIF